MYDASLVSGMPGDRKDMGRETVRRVHPQLPLFLLEQVRRSIVYTPGSVSILSSKDAEAAARAWNGHGALSDRYSHLRPTLCQLEQGARSAVDAYEERARVCFAPKCLTLYLSNRCNLSCSYCYASQAGRSAPTPGDPADRDSSPVLDERAAEAGARLVIESCRRQNSPFVLALHGGGEPTLHWDLVQKLRCLTVRMAQEAGLEWLGYIATNGVLAPDPDACDAARVTVERARWLGQNFGRVGLSCDGPPDLHDRLRPLRDGRSSALVEQTAEAIREAGGQLEVRATITPETVARQAEILEYARLRLGASIVRFEPVYRVGEGGFRSKDASGFVRQFLLAEERAADLGCNLSYSGVRLDEFHGPYCDVLSDNLRMLPDGSVTTCFLQIDPMEEPTRVIGRWDRQNGLLQLDLERIAVLKRRASEIPNECGDCLNQFHCARGCPEHCAVFPLPGGKPLPIGGRLRGDLPARRPTSQERFRCLVNKELSVAWITKAAGALEAAERSRRPGNQALPLLTVGGHTLTRDGLPSCGRTANHVSRQGYEK